MEKQFISHLTLNGYATIEGNIDTIEIGSILPNVFGQLMPVTRIVTNGVDYKGRKFIMVYQKHGESTGEMSHTFYQA